jgi:hypothetical protein
VSTEAPVTQTPSKTKNANGRGSTYIVTKANGKKVRKAAINDVNGKRRVKTFKIKADAEDWLAEQRRARELGENTYAANPQDEYCRFPRWLAHFSQEQRQTQYLSLLPKCHQEPDKSSNRKSERKYIDT